MDPFQLECEDGKGCDPPSLLDVKKVIAGCCGVVLGCGGAPAAPPPAPPPAPVSAVSATEKPAPTPVASAVAPVAPRAGCDKDCAYAVVRKAHDACVAELETNAEASCSSFALADITADESKLRTLVDGCTAECRTELAKIEQRRRAAAEEEKTAADRKMAYRKCMLAEDSKPATRTALRLDVEVYKDIMLKAGRRCGAASQCARLEQLTTHRCDYGH